ncbi:MAG: NADH:ubiquinone reductase (Na(+)-transporting) subunit C [Cyclobacteriaceae bacterium]|nr:NADH:ubiquinone reductase (Na(+)-transporting) subunit C [Cyclobacteriaceae bacterium]UYN87793.1 MAG: NADH:ubiquinone reductase (Na(+)-transporting) subunit C [Cyclobacteriaceae bacterium]
MRQSNLYIVLYAAALTVVCGGLLALASEGLKEKQQANIELEQKKNILSTVMELPKGANIEELYAKKVKSFVVDSKGKTIEGAQAKDVVVLAEYKKPADQRMLPVYEFRNESNPEKIDFVVLPVFGFGLWDNIWGFVALQEDLNTIQGVSYQHKGETPGLGARIDSKEIQDRYKGKSIYDNDNLVSVVMMKGEGVDYSSDKHKVDGMSGATLTAKGVNNMLSQYLSLYENYLKNIKATNAVDL